MNKMIVNHLDKLYVTSDAATIIRELEVSVKKGACEFKICDVVCGKLFKSGEE